MPKQNFSPLAYAVTKCRPGDVAKSLRHDPDKFAEWLEFMSKGNRLKTTFGTWRKERE